MALNLVNRSDELLVIEQDYAPDAQSPPPHYHPSQDEHFDVLEGSVAVSLDGADRVYSAGQSFDVPAGTIHTMGPSDGPARIRWEVRPALRTWEFLSEMPESLEDRIAHVGRFSDEFRLAGT